MASYGGIRDSCDTSTGSDKNDIFIFLIPDLVFSFVGCGPDLKWSSDKLLHYWNHRQVPGDRQGPAIEEEDFESVSPKRGSGKRFSQIRSRKWLETGLQGEDPVSSTERCVFFLISCQLHNFHKASSMCQKVVIWYIIQNSQVAQPGPWQWWVVGDWRRY